VVSFKRAKQACSSAGRWVREKSMSTRCEQQPTDCGHSVR
ncbi:hypothetical protein CSUI_006326, partial [Cystoisospora suis]